MKCFRKPMCRRRHSELGSNGPEAVNTSFDDKTTSAVNLRLIKIMVACKD